MADAGDLIMKRGLALVADGLAILFGIILLALPITAIFAPTMSEPVGVVFAATIYMMTIFMPFLALPYFTWFEGRRGQSPGKRIVGLTVTKADGSDIGYFEAFLRHLFDFIDSLPAFWIIGIFSIASTEKKQRLGDIAAGTVVRDTNSVKADES